MASPVIILIPVFNDWSAVSQLLSLLDKAFGESAKQGEYAVHAFLVDDGSTEELGNSFDSVSSTVLKSINILALRRNIGHQRAIAIGLSYIYETLPCEAVVVMDGDGEDRPEDVLALLDEYQRNHRKKIVFAERARRTERFTFKLFYKFYKALHFMFTGRKVQVGNFSVLPFSLLKRLVVTSDLWNHYAAASFKIRMPVAMLPLPRGYRLSGESRMNFVSLIVHGLSAMSVYGDSIGVRLLVGASIAISVVFVATTYVLIMRYGFGVALPDWAPVVAVGGAAMLLQMFTTILIFVFIVLSGRDSASFLPLRDYKYFVERLIPIKGDVRFTLERSKAEPATLIATTNGLDVAP